MKTTTRIATATGALALGLTALVAPPGAHSAPPAPSPIAPKIPGKQINHPKYSGYVDVTNIRMVGRTLRFNVRFTSTRGEVPVNRLNFSALARGTTYKFPTSNLPTRKLSPGQSVGGSLSFQVNNGPRPTLIIYKCDCGKTLATWAVPRGKQKPPPPAGSSGSSQS
ncbi:MAG: hypothetical protein QM728_13960 [Gordonia sp. (in: high G+C Gram-positive bacteria)]|uniref:hypothetical protein n=1 Tax=Gordonia sp. (in: high G+C Gram-positive bacteria) TaxID=84139 RepID=UPI0039E36C7E